MADDATLKDALAASDETPTTPVVEATPAETEIVAPKIVDAPDQEAIEIGRILRESGVSKDQLNALLEAPKALEALKYSIQNNPAEFLSMLERTDPRTGERFLETMADTYVNRYGDKGKASGKPNGDTNELQRQLEAQQEQLNSMRSEREQERARAAFAVAQQRYNARVDDLFGLEGVKNLGLTKSEEKAMRARLNADLGADQTVVERISRGNFVDVPKAFQGIIDEWATDKKAAVEAQKAQRDRATKGAFPEFQNGPNPWMVDIADKTFDSWDATEEGFAKALQGAR